MEDISKREAAAYWEDQYGKLEKMYIDDTSALNERVAELKRQRDEIFTDRPRSDGKARKSKHSLRHV